jgi:hypothetical protein
LPEPERNLAATVDFHRIFTPGRKPEFILAARTAIARRSEQEHVVQGYLLGGIVVEEHNHRLAGAVGLFTEPESFGTSPACLPVPREDRGVRLRQRNEIEQIPTRRGIVIETSGIRRPRSLRILAPERIEHYHVGLPGGQAIAIGVDS